MSRQISITGMDCDDSIDIPPCCRPYPILIIVCNLPNARSYEFSVCVFKSRGWGK